MLSLKAKWFHDAIESDVRALLWSKDPTFDGDAIGTDKDGQPWIRREALSPSYRHISTCE